MKTILAIICSMFLSAAVYADTFIQWQHVAVDTDGAPIVTDFFEIYKDNVLWSTVASDGVTTNYQLTVDAPGTSAWKIRAVAADGTLGVFSAEIVHTQSSGVPEVPGNFAVTNTP